MNHTTTHFIEVFGIAVFYAMPLQCFMQWHCCVLAIELLLFTTMNERKEKNHFDERKVLHFALQYGIIKSGKEVIQNAIRVG